MRRRAVTQRAFQPAAASHLLPARAPTAPHLAQHTSHATLCAPLFARSTSHAARSTHHARKTTNAPRAAAWRSFQPAAASHSPTARAPTAPLSAQHSARATRHAHDLARRSLSHAHTHQREIRRTARSTLPAHRLLALASNSRADRTTQFAQQHAPAHCAPSPLRTRAHTSVRNTPRTHHVARLAPHTAHTQRSPSAPPRSPSAHAPRPRAPSPRATCAASAEAPTRHTRVGHTPARTTLRASLRTAHARRSPSAPPRSPSAHAPHGSSPRPARARAHTDTHRPASQSPWGGGSPRPGFRAGPRCDARNTKLGTPCPSLPGRPLLRPLHHHRRGDVGARRDPHPPRDRLLTPPPVGW